MFFQVFKSNSSVNANGDKMAFKGLKDGNSWLSGRGLRKISVRNWPNAIYVIVTQVTTLCIKNSDIVPLILM